MQTKELFSLCERLKTLRNKFGYTQVELAKKLGITRSSVNGWEMGLAVPSIQFIIELSKIFNVSSDYFLGLDETVSVKADGLTSAEISVISDLINCLKSAHSSVKEVM